MKLIALTLALASVGITQITPIVTQSIGQVEAQYGNQFRCTLTKNPITAVLTCFDREKLYVTMVVFGDFAHYVCTGEDPRICFTMNVGFDSYKVVLTVNGKVPYLAWHITREGEWKKAQ